MRSDLLVLVLLDDRVGKITRPCPFCTPKYEWTSGFFGLCMHITSQMISIMGWNNWNYLLLNCEKLLHSTLFTLQHLQI